MAFMVIPMAFMVIPMAFMVIPTVNHWIGRENLQGLAPYKLFHWETMIFDWENL